MLLPAYVPETQSEVADRILSAADGIWISDLVVAELLVSLVRKVRLGNLSEEQERRVREVFAEHIERGILRRIPVASKHFDAAVELARHSPSLVRTLDALHLAVAREHSLLLATFDRRLEQAARGLGFEVSSLPTQG